MHEKRGVRTRVMLIAPLVLVIASVTGASLLIVRDRIRQQFSNNLAGRPGAFGRDLPEL